jgi:hypothetical protein
VTPLVRQGTPVAGDPSAVTRLLASSNSASLPATPWRVTRGGDADGLSADARAVRVGARLVDLELQVAAGDSAAAQTARDVAALLAPVPGSGPATTIYADVAARAGAVPDTLRALLAGGWREATALVPHEAALRGAWLETARVAAVRHDTAFFRAPAWATALGRIKASGALTHEVAAQVRTAASMSDWDALERALGAAIR